MSLLTVQNLCIRLDRREIVRNACFSVEEGLTVLLGRNGCGKSTLLRALLGVIPSAGEMRLREVDLHRLNARRRARLIGYLPQRQSIPSGMRVIDYVALGASPESGLFSPPGQDALSRAEKLLDEMRLCVLSSRPMDRLSGGEARLVALCRLRMQNSLLSLMDEPLSSLDYARAHEFLSDLRRRKENALLSLHDPSLAWQYADRILLMRDGQVVCLNREDLTSCERMLQSVYGPQLRFETVGNHALPLWQQ